MRILSLLPITAHAFHRLARWVVAADCTCGRATADDYEHAPSCPHPLLRRELPRIERPRPHSRERIVYVQGDQRRERRRSHP